MADSTWLSPLLRVLDTGRLARPSLLGILALMLAMPLVACGDDPGPDGPVEEAVDTEPADDDPFDVVFIPYTREIPYYGEMIAGMELAAEELGVNLVVQHADFDVTGQIDLIDSAVQRGFDGIIHAPMDRAALMPPTRRAYEAGIPVVLTGDELGEEGREYVLTYVGQIFHDVGEAKARWLVDELDGAGKILVVHGPRGLDYVEAQREAYEEIFAEYPDIEVIEGSYGDWSGEHGLSQTETLLLAHPDADAIYYDNDDLAIGGLRGVRERGIDYDDILLISSDGTMVSFEAVQRGELDMMVTIRPYLVGYTAVHVMYEHLSEGTMPPYPVEVEMFAIDASNVEDLTWDDVR